MLKWSYILKCNASQRVEKVNRIKETYHYQCLEKLWKEQRNRFQRFKNLFLNESKSIFKIILTKSTQKKNCGKKFKKMERI